MNPSFTTLCDLDVSRPYKYSLFYRVESDQIVDLYANAHQYDPESDSYFPGLPAGLSRERIPQHELNLTLQEFAETGGPTVVVPANMRGFEMILPTDKRAKQ